MADLIAIHGSNIYEESGAQTEIRAYEVRALTPLHFVTQIAIKVTLSRGRFLKRTDGCEVYALEAMRQTGVITRPILLENQSIRKSSDVCHLRPSRRRVKDINVFQTRVGLTHQSWM